jgi:hypothetical protein
MRCCLYDYSFSLAESTHPVCAALDLPLFAFGGKRVRKKYSSLFCSPLFEEERVVGELTPRL